MVTEVEMKNALQQYVDGFNEKDSYKIVQLFADNATIEDPVGGGRIVEGIDDISVLYKGAVKVVSSMTLDTPIRGSHSNAAAMAFTIKMEHEGKPMTIQAIDVMKFNDKGKIVEMKAYHGPSNVETN